jgi:hypothetical protein
MTWLRILAAGFGLFIIIALEKMIRRKTGEQG